MEFGAIFPTNEIGNDPTVIRDFAQAAEELGYSYITIFDHVIAATHDNRETPPATPYKECDPFHEPLVLFAYLAGLTKKISFSTGVMILPQRQTVMVAKQVAELAVLSGGRVRLGVGVGAHQVEFEALGVDITKRGAILDEQIVLLRKLWSEPIIDYAGRFHRVDRAGLNPMPPCPIPIWLGGFVRAAAERAVRLGDGFIFGMSGNVDNQARIIRDLLEKNGRDPAKFGMEFTARFLDGPAAWHETVQKWSEPGERYISLRTMGPASLSQDGPRLKTPRQHIDALQTFMSEVKDYRTAI